MNQVEEIIKKYPSVQKIIEEFSHQRALSPLTTDSIEEARIAHALKKVLEVAKGNPDLEFLQRELSEEDQYEILKIYAKNALKEIINSGGGGGCCCGNDDEMGSGMHP